MTDQQRLADRILELQAEAASVDDLLRELPASGREGTRRLLMERRDQARALLHELREQLGRPRSA